ncbi:MAG: F-type H+-transporting ATPase subunit b [Actinomycetota bacterium]|jgi:F-type H+-transporting ATPase subunit b|nr:atpF [Cryptosporangiaceae bacterium]MDQ1678930.1 F-type H+-transporting ATPase subunit b [Actinomycetota bacterium]
MITDTVTFLAAGEEPNPLIPHTAELVVGVIAFAILFFFLKKAVYPRFEQTFRDRQETIEGGIKRAQEAQAEAQRLLEQYKAQLAEARTEAAKIRDDARAEGTRIVEELRTEAHEQAQRIIQRGEETLAAERERLVVQLRAEIGDLAVELAERVIGEALADEARRAGTIDRFLSELDATPGRR